MGNYLPVKDKELFLKYAIPCGRVLVKRGAITQKFLDEMRERVVSGGKLRDEYVNSFKVALFQLSEIARREGKEEINYETIRKYFYSKEHDNAIEWSSKFNKYVDEKLCRVKPGRILEIDHDAIAETPLGELKIKLDFIPDAKVGDYVTVHYDHGCEIISEELAKEMWERFK